MGAIPQVNSSNREVSQLQSNIIPPLNNLLANLLVQGVLLTNVVLTTGQDNTVNTGLGRAFIGFIVTRPRANAVVYESTTTNTLPQLQIILKTSATVTVDLYVF